MTATRARLKPTTIYGALVALAAITTILVVAIPEEETLGWLVRLTMFHGASTWVNLMAFTAAAVFSVAYLAVGRQRAYRWASALRYLALLHWLINTVLGVWSMQASWGGIRWDEPRLAMTFWVLLGAGLVFAVDFTFDKAKLTAVFDIALAVLLWGMLAGAENMFHPDSPVFNSGWGIIGLFLGIVAALMLMAVLAVVLIRRRLDERAV